MKITMNFLLVFLLSFFLLFGVTGYFIVDETKKSIMTSEIHKMNTILLEKELEIKNLNDRASEDLVFALKNPLFTEYFELPETKDGNKFENGELQYTPQQNEIKLKLEQWIWHFQNKFQVDETCIIDTSGQEHARLVLKNIAPVSDLSSEESSAPFFEPSFQKEIDQVHIQYPYLSPDSERWVFAYTSPIVLGDGDKPAFYHFEMPVSIFQKLLTPDIGRMYVIDSDGMLIADSEHEFIQNTKEMNDYFPQVKTISDSIDFENMIDDMRLQESGSLSYTDNDVTHNVVFTHIELFGWILVYEIDESIILSSNSIISDVQNNIVLIFSISGMISITGFYFVSRQISKPLNKLIDECDHLDPENLYPIKANVPNELVGIKNSVNKMIEKIFVHEEKIKLNLEEIQSQGEEITAQNEEIEFQNRELYKQLEITAEAQRKKGEFLSMMTHEFKTPLTPILSWTDLLLTKVIGDVSEKQESALKKINDNAMKLLGLINDVLDVNKLDLEQMTFNKADTNSKEIALFFANNYEAVMMKNKIKFTYTNIDDIPLYTDKNRIEQVLRIYVTNALDFIPKIEGKIELRVTQEEDFVVFSVIDNGVGIPKENQGKLFTKFYQIDTSVTRKHGGSGLGLSVAKGIADGLNGEVGVKSEKGRGSEFYIKIPKISITKSIK